VSPDTIRLARRCCHSITRPEPAPRRGKRERIKSKHVSSRAGYTKTASSFGPWPTAVADEHVAQGAPGGQLADSVRVVKVAPQAHDTIVCRWVQRRTQATTCVRTWRGWAGHAADGAIVPEPVSSSGTSSSLTKFRAVRRVCGGLRLVKKLRLLPSDRSQTLVAGGEMKKHHATVRTVTPSLKHGAASQTQCRRGRRPRPVWARRRKSAGARLSPPRCPECALVRRNGETLRHDQPTPKKTVVHDL